MSEQTDSESEEEMIIFAEFEDTVNIEKYRNIHILGIENKKPIIQMDNAFFIGHYVNPLGTYMFFEDDPSPKVEDPLFDQVPEKNLKYVCKSKKLIKIDHAYVSPKENIDQNIKKDILPPETEEVNLEIPNFSSAQEGLDVLKSHLVINVPNTRKKSEPQPSEPQPSTSSEPIPMDTT